MELRYLNEFVVLARTCHYHEAADLLFISQSTLSKHIKAIENELGQELFERSTRTVKLTEFGQAFLPYAVEFGLLEKEYKDKLLYSPAKEKRMVIAISALVTLHKMWPFFTTFNDTFPGTRLEIMERFNRNMSLLDYLRKDRCDLVIVSSLEPDPVEEDDLYAVSYGQDVIALAVSLEHPFASRASVRIADLLDEKIIQNNKSRLAESLGIDEAGSDVINVSRSEMVMKMVAKNMGIGLMTRSNVSYFGVPEIAMVSIADSPTIYYYAYCLEKNRNDEVLAAALQFIESKNTK